MVPQRSSNYKVMRWLALLFGMLSGTIIFFNYFLPSPTLDGIAQPILQWVVLLTGASLLFAAIHLLMQHARRLMQNPASGLLVLGFAVTFVAGLLAEGFSNGLGLWIYRWTIAPGMAALFALLPIFLAYALYRRLHVRDVGMFLFAATLLIVLIGQTPALVERFPVLAALRHNVLIGPAAVAFRGVLIGLALGIVLSVLARLHR
ncbi:MAG: hypothetical protein GY759_21385 [Chloroflexi bacterium]|nr:hypothetical protein [Chloroflexota bacterium]